MSESEMEKMQDAFREFGKQIGEALAQIWEQLYDTIDAAVQAIKKAIMELPEFEYEKFDWEERRAKIDDRYRYKKPATSYRPTYNKQSPQFYYRRRSK